MKKLIVKKADLLNQADEDTPAWTIENIEDIESDYIRCTHVYEGREIFPSTALSDRNFFPATEEEYFNQ